MRIRAAHLEATPPTFVCCLEKQYSVSVLHIHISAHLLYYIHSFPAQLWKHDQHQRQQINFITLGHFSHLLKFRNHASSNLKSTKTEYISVYHKHIALSSYDSMQNSSFSGKKPAHFLNVPAPVVSHFSTGLGKIYRLFYVVLF